MDTIEYINAIDIIAICLISNLIELQPHKAAEAA